MDEQTLKERAKYDLIWSQYPSYRDCSPGEVFTSFFLQYFEKEIEEGQTLIDFGSGTGRACRAFLAKNLKVSLVDFSSYALDEEIQHLTTLCPDIVSFTEACLWKLPKNLLSADWIYCCDVLEHIPTNRIDQVLKGMASRMKKGGYLSICLQEDLSGKQLGFPLHLTIKDKHWWLQRLSRYFTVLKEEPILEGINLNCLIGPLK
ncbi:MAG TPA: class I SAM-dependent methyltransferase [Rhabdochlamydiaceae bacterium]|nr:class I SAM-dependent methyltransferase [Rhabdochlamydiaceae bacterium]